MLKLELDSSLPQASTARQDIATMHHQLRLEVGLKPPFPVPLCP